MQKGKILFSECSCKKEESLGGGKAFTEFYENEMQAFAKVLEKVTQQYVYWAVHLNERHITAVNLNGVWYGGLTND